MARLLIFIPVMSTIALTVWNSIISPVYDAATTFLLVGQNGEREMLLTEGRTSVEIAGLLATKNVYTVICGAISALPARILSANNIAVVPWIRGNVEEVIDAYRRGNLNAPFFHMPGCEYRKRGTGRGRCCRRRGIHQRGRQP
jgi:predicted Fe-Mo cluster-binding NifX family protein